MAKMMAMMGKMISIYFNGIAIIPILYELDSWGCPIVGQSPS
jgi:hypothetical protein